MAKEKEQDIEQLKAQFIELKALYDEQLETIKAKDELIEQLKSQVSGGYDEYGIIVNPTLSEEMQSRIETYFKDNPTMVDVYVASDGTVFTADAHGKNFAVEYCKINGLEIKRIKRK